MAFYEIKEADKINSLLLIETHTSYEINQYIRKIDYLFFKILWKDQPVIFKEFPLFWLSTLYAVKAFTAGSFCTLPVDVNSEP